MDGLAGCIPCEVIHQGTASMAGCTNTISLRSSNQEMFAVCTTQDPDSVLEYTPSEQEIHPR